MVLRLRAEGSTGDEIGRALLPLNLHPWNFLTLLTLGGVEHAREWMRATGMWTEFVKSLDRNELDLSRLLAADPDWEAQSNEDGSISFTMDLNGPGSDESEG